MNGQFSVVQVFTLLCFKGQAGWLHHDPEEQAGCLHHRENIV